MHTVHIGIGSHYHLIISKAVETFLYVEGCLKKIELLILIYHLLCQTVAVERLTAKGEHSLCVHVTALCDTSARRVTLCDEYA